MNIFTVIPSLCMVWVHAANQRKKRIAVAMLAIMMSLILSGSVYINTEQLMGGLILSAFSVVFMSLVYLAMQTKEMVRIKASSGYHQRRKLEQKLEEVLRWEDWHVVKEPGGSCELRVYKESGLFGVVSYAIWFQRVEYSHVDENTLHNVYKWTSEMYAVHTDLAMIDVRKVTSWEMDDVKTCDSEMPWEFEADASELKTVLSRAYSMLDEWAPSSAL